MEKRVLWLRELKGKLSNDLYVNGVGVYDAMDPALVDRPHGTDDYLLMHFHTPVAVHHDGAIRSYPAHTFFLWTPGHRHTFGHLRRPWVHSWMHAGGAALERAIGAASIPLDRPVAFADSYAVDRHLENIFSELTTYGAPDADIVESYVRIWIRSLDREIRPQSGSARLPTRLLSVIRYIEANIAGRITLADLAHQSLLSVSRFSSEFRKHLRASPIEYVLHLRLRHALHLLRDRNLQVARVSERVGFSDPFYFSRQFRRRYGVSPQDYRKRLRAD
jgi:AraC family transcriptional regulator, arabinose operon regulatory protein